MSARPLLTVLAVLVLLQLLATPASSALVWSVSSDDNLYRQVDTETGATPMSGTGFITLPDETVFGCRGLASSGTGQDRFLFTLAEVGLADSVRLVQIDLTSGTTLGRGTLSARFRSLAFDCSGALWGVTENEDASGEALYRDLLPAAASGTAPVLVMNLGGGDFGEAIASHAFGVVYHVSGEAQQVFERIDVGQGSIADLPLTGSPGPVTALTYWNPQGLFLGASIDQLFRLTLGGDVTAGATMNHFSSGLAFSGGPCGTATGLGPAEPRAASMVVASPFRGRTVVRFDVARAGEGSLRIFDVTGRAVRELLVRAALQAGPHERSWDGRGDDGVELPAGVYLLRLAIGDGLLARRVVKLD